MKKKLEGKDSMTPWEEFLEKKRDKKKQKTKNKQVSIEEMAATRTAELQIFWSKHTHSILCYMELSFCQAPELDLSDDELPPDVDLDDPFFAEELGSVGKFPCYDIFKKL